jgi:hypothetical protein
MGPVRGTYGPVRAPPSRVDPPPYGGREAKSDPTREGSACVGIVRPPPCGGGRTIPTQALRVYSRVRVVGPLSPRRGVEVAYYAKASLTGKVAYYALA